MDATNDGLDMLGALILAERARWVSVARAEGLGPQDAIEAVQESLCKVLRGLVLGDTEVPRDRLAAYVAVVVRNAARNGRRRHHRARPHVPLDELDEMVLADEQPDSEALVARAEEHVRLHACVARLCDTQRAVVTLRLLEERAGEDVAGTLGITRNHVDVLLHRAKRQLRSCLIEERVTHA
ncbi:MAG: RNA polymerase sigma factor [Nannocystales bacterium]